MERWGPIGSCYRNRGACPARRGFRPSRRRSWRAAGGPSFRYTWPAMVGILLVLFGYLLGAVPVGYLVGRAFGVDVRRVGSGNIGTANVLRAAGEGGRGGAGLGWRAAGRWPCVVPLVGARLRVFVPVVLARALVGSEWLHAAVALAAVVGHCWPVFLRVKGGKGLATGGGAAIGLAAVAGLG